MLRFQVDYTKFDAICSFSVQAFTKFRFCLECRYYSFCKTNNVTWNYNMYNHANIKLGRKRPATCQKTDRSYTYIGISQRSHSKAESILTIFILITAPRVLQFMSPNIRFYTKCGQIYTMFVLYSHLYWHFATFTLLKSGKGRLLERGLLE